MVGLRASVFFQGSLLVYWVRVVLLERTGAFVIGFKVSGRTKISIGC